MQINNIVEHLSNERRAVLAFGPSYFVGRENALASPAKESGKVKFHDPSFDSSRTKPQVVDSLAEFSIIVDFDSMAFWTVSGPRQLAGEYLVGAEFSLGFSGIMSGELPQERTRSDIHSASLIVPIGGSIDVIQLRQRELDSSESLGLRPSNGLRANDALSARGDITFLLLAKSQIGIKHDLQSGTIFRVVRDYSLFEVRPRSMRE